MPLEPTWMKHWNTVRASSDWRCRAGISCVPMLSLVLFRHPPFLEPKIPLVTACDTVHCNCSIWSQQPRLHNLNPLNFLNLLNLRRTHHHQPTEIPPTDVPVNRPSPQVLDHTLRTIIPGERRANSESILIVVIVINTTATLARRLPPVSYKTRPTCLRERRSS